MSLTIYNKNESLALNGKIESSALQEQIHTSSITIAIDGITGYGDGYYDITFKDTLPDESLLDDVIAAHDGKSITEVELVQLSEKRDGEGKLLFTSGTRVGSSLEIATHNFADKTTWYNDSSRVIDEIPVYVDGYRYELNNEYLIDLYHGKLHNEDNIIKNGYSIDVIVDGYLQIQYTQFEPSIDYCDFTVNYIDGYIDFLKNQTGSDITISYSYAVGSTWVLKPSDGKVIDIEKSEIQMSSNVVFNDAINFDIWAYNTHDLPNKVPVKKTVYKSISNLTDEAQGSYPVVPPIGGKYPYGSEYETVSFKFNYSTLRQLYSSMGLELRICTKNNRELVGEKATATFYCTIVDE